MAEIERKWFEGTKDSEGRVVIAPGWVYSEPKNEMSKSFQEYLAEICSHFDMSFERRLAKACANWMTIVSAHMNENGISETVSPQTFIDAKKLKDLAVYVEFTDLLDFSTAKRKVFPRLIDNFDEERTWDIIEELGLLEKTESGEIDSVVDEIISGFPDEAEKHRSGKKDMVGFFMGRVMKSGKVKANPKELNGLIRKKLES